MIKPIISPDLPPALCEVNKRLCAEASGPSGVADGLRIDALLMKDIKRRERMTLTHPTGRIVRRSF